VKSPTPLNDTIERTNNIAAAERAQLHYVMDGGAGITRVATRGRFRFLNPRGKEITDEVTLFRIKKLAIPPAWTQVWICPDAAGHIQATGRDARGRKQYRYHERWRAVRDESKFDRLVSFASALPQIRRKVHGDLSKPGMPREKILGTVVRLLETTMIRVGNEEYARQNRSFGLTTLRNPHARVWRDENRFEFRGKSGVQHRVTIRDRRIAPIIRRCQEIPGQELFQYLDESGKRHGISSADVNDDLRSSNGGEYTAKDFRTWAGTLLAAQTFQRLSAETAEASKRAVVQCIEEVARHLRNTAAVCRKCYIHPALVDSYLDGSFRVSWTGASSVRSRAKVASLTAEETALLRWLRKRSRKPEKNAIGLAI